MKQLVLDYQKTFPNESSNNNMSPDLSNIWTKHDEVEVVQDQIEAGQSSPIKQADGT